MIDQTFRALYGQYCWAVRWDRQTDLWIEFGQPHLRVYEPRPNAQGSERVRQLLRYRRVLPRGEWSFAVVAAHWRLALPDLPAVTGASRSDRARNRALRLLSGQRLCSATVDPQTGATRLGFDLGAVLEVRRVAPDEPDEMWLLYKPSGYVLAVRGSGEYDHRRATGHKPPKWRAIPQSRPAV